MKEFDTETIQSLLRQTGFVIIQTESQPTVFKIKATHKGGELNIEYTNSELGLSLRSSSELEILVNKREVILAFENDILTKQRDEQKLIVLILKHHSLRQVKVSLILLKRWSMFSNYR